MELSSIRCRQELLILFYVHFIAFLDYTGTANYERMTLSMNMFYDIRRRDEKHTSE